MWELFCLFGKNQETIKAIVNDVNCKKRQRINELKKLIEQFNFIRQTLNSNFLDMNLLNSSINKANAEIAQLEREIAEDRYNQSKGESKMDNKEELKRSLAEEEQRAKDSLANVEKMKKQLEELNKKEVEVSATGVYLKKPILNEYYNYIENQNVVNQANKFYTGIDFKRFDINNCFATKEQAEQEALRREGQEFIRRCAMLWNKDNDWRTDMSAGTEYMYYIGYGFRNKLFVVKTALFITDGTICFDNQELAEKCIAELKAKYNEEQIKTIFGVK